MTQRKQRKTIPKKSADRINAAVQHLFEIVTEEARAVTPEGTPTSAQALNWLFFISQVARDILDHGVKLLYDIFEREEEATA